MKLESFESKYKDVVDEGCILSGYLNSYKLTIFCTYNPDGIPNYIMQCEVKNGGLSTKTFEDWKGLTIFIKNLV